MLKDFEIDRRSYRSRANLSFVRAMTVVVVVAGFCSVVAQPATATDSLTRSVRFRVADSLPGSDRVVVRGTVTVEVPKSWTREKTASQSRGELRYRFPRASGCVARVTVSTRAVATTLSAAAQVERALARGHRVARIERGSRPRGAWGIDEIDHSAAARPTRGLYAIGPIHITGHRYLQLRAIADFTGPCSDAAVRKGTVPTTLKRIVRDGRFAVS